MSDIEKELREYEKFLQRRKVSSRKKAILSRIALAVVSIVLLLPIKFFLYYSILSGIHADRLVWVLFYCYVPLSTVVEILLAIVRQVIEAAKEDD